MENYLYSPLLLLFLLKSQPALNVCDAHRLVTCETGELVAPARDQGSETLLSINWEGGRAPLCDSGQALSGRVPLTGMWSCDVTLAPCALGGALGVFEHVLPQLSAAHQRDAGSPQNNAASSRACC